MGLNTIAKKAMSDIDDWAEEKVASRVRECNGDVHILRALCRKMETEARILMAEERGNLITTAVHVEAGRSLMRAIRKWEK